MISTAFGEEKETSFAFDAPEEKKRPRPPSGAPPRRISKPRPRQQSDRSLSRNAFESVAESKMESSGGVGSGLNYGDDTSEPTGLLGVSAGARAKILQSQREAAMRRRSVQMRSGVLVRADAPRGANTAKDPQQTSAVPRFSVPKATSDKLTVRPFMQKADIQKGSSHDTWNEKENVIGNSGPLERNSEQKFAAWSVPEDNSSNHRQHDCKTNKTESENGNNAREKPDAFRGQNDHVTLGGKLKTEKQRGADDAREQPIEREGAMPQGEKSNSDAHKNEELCLNELERRSLERSHNESDHNDCVARHSGGSPRRFRRVKSNTKTALFADDDHAEREESKPAMDDEVIKGENAKLDESSKQPLPFTISDLTLDSPEGMKTFLMSPCPKQAGTIECYVKRHKSGKKALNPEYRVYMKEGDIFLMTSKKRGKKTTSNYLISIGRSDHNKRSSNIIGKLRSNFVGTEYTIYDAGRNPRDTDPFFDEKNDIVRSELGAVLYASNIISNRGPRRMKVCINKVDDEGKSLKHWQPAYRDEEMAQVFKHRIDSAMRKLVSLENKPPRWNEELGAYVLNFNGRVTQASVKNFQLVEENGDETKSILQFGRVAKDEFTLDFQWPMSPFQAFAIALSSCDSKIACD